MSPTSPRVNVAHKLCHVCGDQAYAFNYNGLTCESCKSFFRRNAFSIEEFACKHNDACIIDVKNRRFCQKCRLRKCFAVGMKKEMLKARPAQTQEEERAESEETHALHLYESQCLELVRKMATTFHEKPKCGLRVLGYAPNVGQLFTSQRPSFIQRIAKLAQSIEGFAGLTHQDQMTLLRSSFSAIVLLRSSFYFSFEKDSLIVRVDPQCNETVFVRLTLFYGDESNCLMATHRSVAHTAHDLIGEDVRLLELLVILLLFKPTAGTSCPELIRYYHTRYLHLLERYLVHKLGPGEAPQRMAARIRSFLDPDAGALGHGVSLIMKELESGSIHNDGLKQYIASLVT